MSFVAIMAGHWGHWPLSFRGLGLDLGGALARRALPDSAGLLEALGLRPVLAGADVARKLRVWGMPKQGNPQNEWFPLCLMKRLAHLLPNP